MKMYFYPARGARHILSVILCAPALYKAHADGAHLGELVDGLESMVDRLSEQLSEFLVVEDLEAAAAGDLADSCGVEAMMVVAVSTLDENAGVTQTLCIDFSSNIIQVDTFANVATRVFNSGVAIDVGEQAQAEAVLVVGWVSESINQHAGGGSVVSLSYTIIQLIVHNRAPVTGLLILHWLHIPSGHVLRNHTAASLHGLRPVLSHLFIWRHVGRRRGISWQLEGAGWPRACRRVGVGAAAGGRWRVGRVWRDGEGASSAVLLEGLWEGGVERHVRLIVTQVAELHQQTVLRVELAMSWHQHRRKHRTFNSFVVIWVDTHFFLFGTEWILAHL